MAAAFQVATTDAPGVEVELVGRGVAELGGQRLRGGEPDADAVADGR